MITHYDITTGEVIGDESCDRPRTTAVRADQTATLRLLPVHEALMTQRPERRLPADVALLPVDTLVSRWS